MYGVGAIIALNSNTALMSEMGISGLVTPNGLALQLSSAMEIDDGNFGQNIGKAPRCFCVSDKLLFHTA